MQHGTASKVDGETGLRTRPRKRLKLADLSRQAAEIDQRKIERAGRCDNLDGPTRPNLESRAQNFMTPDDLAQACSQHGSIKIAREAKHDRDVVSLARRLHLMQKPETLLGEGKR